MKTQRQTTTNDTAADWHAFHAGAAREYFACWHDAGKRAVTGVSRLEAAYYLLENTGLLWRATADDNVRGALSILARNDRVSMVCDCFAHILSFTMADQLESLLAHELLSVEQMDALTGLMVRRDGLQCAFDMAAYLVDDVLDNDVSLLAKHADVAEFVHKVDKQLLARMDVAACISRVMEPGLPQVKVTLDRKAYWWFYRAREWDQRYTRIVQNTTAFETFIGLESGSIRKRAAQMEEMTQPLPLLRLSPEQVNCAGQLVPELMAAKDSRSRCHVLVWNGDPDSLATSLAGMKPKPARPTDKKRAANAAQFTATYATADAPPHEDLDRKGNAVAQWILAGDARTPRHDCPVALLDLKAHMVLRATATYFAKTRSITLARCAWRDIKPIANEPEKLLLVVLAKQRSGGSGKKQ